MAGILNWARSFLGIEDDKESSSTTINDQENMVAEEIEEEEKTFFEKAGEWIEDRLIANANRQMQNGQSMINTSSQIQESVEEVAKDFNEGLEIMRNPDYGYGNGNLTPQIYSPFIGYSRGYHPIGVTDYYYVETPPTLEEIQERNTSGMYKYLVENNITSPNYKEYLATKKEFEEQSNKVEKITDLYSEYYKDFQSDMDDSNKEMLDIILSTSFGLAKLIPETSAYGTVASFVKDFVDVSMEDDESKKIIDATSFSFDTFMDILEIMGENIDDFVTPDANLLTKMSKLTSGELAKYLGPIGTIKDLSEVLAKFKAYRMNDSVLDTKSQYLYDLGNYLAGETYKLDELGYEMGYYADNEGNTENSTNSQTKIPETNITQQSYLDGLTPKIAPVATTQPYTPSQQNISSSLGGNSWNVTSYAADEIAKQFSLQAAAQNAVQDAINNIQNYSQTDNPYTLSQQNISSNMGGNGGMLDSISANAIANAIAAQSGSTLTPDDTPDDTPDSKGDKASFSQRPENEQAGTTAKERDDTEDRAMKYKKARQQKRISGQDMIYIVKSLGSQTAAVNAVIDKSKPRLEEIIRDGRRKTDKENKMSKIIKNRTPMHQRM